MHAATASLCFLASVILCASLDAPLWSTDIAYEATGTIEMPYSEIVEPFRAYYDGKNRRSLQVYYDGLNYIYQRADQAPYGALYKVVPETTETTTNEMKCFGANGTSDEPMTSIQSVLPATDNFTNMGPDSYEGLACDRYVMKETNGYKRNTYTLLVLPPTEEMPFKVPVYFEFVGYDNLFGSHYDKYVIKYVTFKVYEDGIPEKVFEISSSYPCEMFPGPGVAEADFGLRTASNPIGELLTNTGEVDREFDKFKSVHGKEYANGAEHEQRKSHFRHNYRFVHSTNRRRLSYNVAVNHLADLSDEERTTMRGYRYTRDNNGLPFEMTDEMVAATPDTMDWRILGAVTRVKDQGICGSCWSFGTSESIEGALFLAKNSTFMTPLSQQNLIDCTWGYGNNGCDGGEEWRAYEWIMKHGGIATSESYGQYLMADGECHFANATVGARLASYVNVTSGSQSALQTAIATKGPVAVNIDASHRSFSFYSTGVYFEPECGNGMDDLDHSVLAVGYGAINGDAYWLIKNSWSTYWGNNGYTLMSQKDNNCGVATNPTYVNIEM